MNITLYINKRNEERFGQEEEKSKLVNELLDGYYGGIEIKQVTSFTKPSKKKPPQRFEGADSVKITSSTDGPTTVDIEGVETTSEEEYRNEPKFKLTGKLCKEHKVDVDICKNMKH